MWQTNWRDQVWSQITQPWDVIIIGGGITGAGILREAARLGMRALLVEQRDFAWGTSSRSSKLVHGGLRYLRSGKIKLTHDAVRERERLLDEHAGLVQPLGFLLATYAHEHPGRWMYQAGLSLYDLLAVRWSHRYYHADAFQMLAPHLARERLRGGFRYSDAQTDDARLVLRVLQDAVADGGVAINYVAATDLLRADGRVAGVRLHDHEQNRTTEARAALVINATGAWADQLRSQVGRAARMRPLRGSHLIFPAWRVPVAQAISFLHPIDHRPVFVIPWEGATLIGTTDVDHHQALGDEPAISPAEVAYLMAAATALFPSLNLSLDDVIATFAGVRPVVGMRKADPSKEARDHVVWHEDGLLTVTGGKLTTFRLIAHDALAAARRHAPHLPAPQHTARRGGASAPLPSHLPAAVQQRLAGRYGAHASALVAAAQPGELTAIPSTTTLWAELRWAARAEGVVHLDDLLLRRTRLGVLLPRGGEALLPKIRAICQPELGWDDARWDAEVAAYQQLWRAAYSLPEPASVPDWHALLAAAHTRREAARHQRRSRAMRMVGASGVAGLAVAWALRRQRRARMAV